jgi:hypothetical protein
VFIITKIAYFFLKITTQIPQGLIIERHLWVDNIKLDLRDIGSDSRDWIDLAEDRDHWKALVNTVMNRRVP